MLKTTEMNELFLLYVSNDNSLKHILKSIKSMHIQVYSDMHSFQSYENAILNQDTNDH